MKKLSSLTKVVGAFALGALVMTGCKSKETQNDSSSGDAAAATDGEDAAAAGEEGSCGGKDGSCGGKDGSCGGK